MALPNVSIALNATTLVAYPYEPALVEVTVTPILSGSTLISATYSWGESPTPAVDVTTDLIKQHQYTLAGLYTISVTLRDSQGFTTTDSAQVQINRAQDLVPNTTTDIPNSNKHTPLDTLRPAFRLRRGHGTNNVR